MSSSDDIKRQKHLQITQLVRELNHYCLALNGPEDVLDDLIQKTQALTSQFAQISTEKLREHFTPLTHIDRGEGIQPYSPFGGFHNPVSPIIHYSFDGDKVIGICEFGINHEGPQGCVHGGVIAGVYDCILAAAMIRQGLGGPTVKLDITYRAPTLLHSRLRFESWLEKLDGRKVHLHGQCWHGETLLSSAQAIFINNHKRDEHA